ncbi:MAG: hypothetical protein QOH21_431 [Acidobacteriota bacterium]|jgi:hypothetical protein|nr:hypothetical protein [Acidobacteriota bacterium]
MKSSAFLLVVLSLLVTIALLGCNETPSDSPHALSREPISVRGWVEDVDGATRNPIAEMEIARRQEQFAQTSVWVEGNQYASGGVSENGAFIVLDVPPPNATLGFQAPGADGAQLTLQNVPGTADVFIPALFLSKGKVRVGNPKAIQVRLPANIDKAKPTGAFAIIAGHKVPVMATPLREMMDRRDYPSPGGFRPVAIVR